MKEGGWSKAKLEKIDVDVCSWFRGGLFDVRGLFLGHDVVCYR